MKILSHRGYWKTPDQKNSVAAFRHSFECGFGTETDLRDCRSQIVISHDPPVGREMLFSDFLDLASSINPALPLALNIKSDGIHNEIKKLLLEYPSVTNYFCFDMSIPDTFGYDAQRIPFLVRRSEYEPDTPLRQKSNGVWLDGFHEDWFDEDLVLEILNDEQMVVIVSPELHNRNPHNFWQAAKNWTVRDHANLMFCTDRPYELMRHLHDCN